MNSLKNKTYGRKTIRTIDYFHRIIISWVVCFIVGLILGFGINAVITSAKQAKTDTIENTTTYGKVVVELDESFEYKTNMDDGYYPLPVSMSDDMQRYIYRLCYANNIEFSFVMALIQHESTFQPTIISSTNDYGLMQINSINHEWLSEELGITDFLDPYENVKAGIYILSDLFRKYEDPAKVLMAYNMGETGASQLWEKGIFETTYTKNIMKTAQGYEVWISQKKGEN